MLVIDTLIANILVLFFIILPRNLTNTEYKPGGFYGPIAPPGLNAPSSECPPNVVPKFRVPNVPRSRISERAPFRIYEHAECRVFERTCLQRAYVIPCRQQMGSSAVLRARRSALVLAARTGVSRPYLRYGDRGRLQNVSPPSVLFESSRTFTIHRIHRRKKMMDQNFEIRIL